MKSSHTLCTAVEEEEATDTVNVRGKERRGGGENLVGSRAKTAKVAAAAAAAVAVAAAAVTATRAEEKPRAPSSPSMTLLRGGREGKKKGRRVEEGAEDFLLSFPPSLPQSIILPLPPSPSPSDRGREARGEKRPSSPSLLPCFLPLLSLWGGRGEGGREGLSRLQQLPSSFAHSAEGGRKGGRL